MSRSEKKTSENAKSLQNHASESSSSTSWASIFGISSTWMVSVEVVRLTPRRVVALDHVHPTVRTATGDPGWPDYRSRVPAVTGRHAAARGAPFVWRVPAGCSVLPRDPDPARDE